MRPSSSVRPLVLLWERGSPGGTSGYTSPTLSGKPGKVVLMTVKVQMVDRNTYTGTTLYTLIMTGIHVGPRSGGMICEQLEESFCSICVFFFINWISDSRVPGPLRRAPSASPLWEVSPSEEELTDLNRVLRDLTQLLNSALDRTLRDLAQLLWRVSQTVRWLRGHVCVSRFGICVAN